MVKLFLRTSVGNPRVRGIQSFFYIVYLCISMRWERISTRKIKDSIILASKLGISPQADDNWHMWVEKTIFQAKMTTKWYFFFFEWIIVLSVLKYMGYDIKIVTFWILILYLFQLLLIVGEPLHSTYREVPGRIPKFFFDIFMRKICLQYWDDPKTSPLKMTFNVLFTTGKSWQYITE